MEGKRKPAKTARRKKRQQGWEKNDHDGNNNGRAGGGALAESFVRGTKKMLESGRKRKNAG